MVLNGYTTQYGRAAGAIVNYITRSGTNRIHGNVNYYYNGDALNANDWFRNNEGAPRQRAVSNQFGAAVGGPITIPHVLNGKDKLFFFVDYELLHYVLPVSGAAVFLSPQLQAYTLNNVPTQAQGFYNQIFGLYKAAPAYGIAQPVANGPGPLQDNSGNLGCGATGFAGTPTGMPGQIFGVNVPCAIAAPGSGSNINKESLLTGRVDWNISQKNKIFFRFKADRGTQPTYTNFSAPQFDEFSIQPSYEGQLNDTYAFNDHITNQFIFAANWYTAFFGPANAAASLASFPSYFSLTDGGVTEAAGFGALGIPNGFPQGRNVTQYQFVDDLTYIKGKNTLRAGYNFRRDDLSDYDGNSGEYGAFNFGTLGDFVSGRLTGAPTSFYSQVYNSTGTAYLALYNLGVYVQDEWKIRPNLTLSSGIRFDRTGNPLCNNSCFVEYRGAFPATGATTATPYNQLLNNRLPNLFPGVEPVIVQPRVGFNYSPTPHTVIRGGGGIFADLYPNILADPEITNFPNVYTSNSYNGIVAAGGPGSLAANSAAQANAVRTGYANGASYNQLSNTLLAQGVTFQAPTLGGLPPTGTFHQPKYVEYNLQIQQQIGRADAITINYSGNFGYDLVLLNSKVNASLAGSNYTAFAGLNAQSPDPNFSSVNAITSFGHSSYNGVFVNYRHNDAHGLSFGVTYLFSHALDDVTSSPFEPYNGSSITSSLTPTNPDTLNYSNGDNDIRHNLTTDAVWIAPFRFHNYALREVAGGWTLAGKAFYRTGEPFSLTNSLVQGSIGPSIASAVAAEEIAPVNNHNRSAKRYVAGVPNSVPCVPISDFAVDPTTYLSANGTPVPGLALQSGFGNVRRNSFYGPHYFDTDVSLYKNLLSKESFKIQIGANAFNVLNHPNFGQPSGNVGSPGGFGLISNAISAPTSPYGGSAGAVVTGRVLQVVGKLTF